MLNWNYTKESEGGIICVLCEDEIEIGETLIEFHAGQPMHYECYLDAIQEKHFWKSQFV